MGDAPVGAAGTAALQRGKAVAGEFRAFLARGSVMDLAVGVIIGAAFGKIITSLVNDLLMPPLGLLLANVDFRGLQWRIGTDDAGKAVMLSYGAFVSTIVDFLIVALVVFLFLRALRRGGQQPPPAPATRDCPRCFLNVPRQATRCGHCTSELVAV